MNERFPHVRIIQYSASYSLPFRQDDLQETLTLAFYMKSPNPAATTARKPPASSTFNAAAAPLLVELLALPLLVPLLDEPSVAEALSVFSALLLVLVAFSTVVVP